jgi:hypothetical protein
LETTRLATRIRAKVFMVDLLETLPGAGDFAGRGLNAFASRHAGRQPGRCDG